MSDDFNINSLLSHTHTHSARMRIVFKSDDGDVRMDKEKRRRRYDMFYIYNISMNLCFLVPILV